MSRFILLALLVSQLAFSVPVTSEDGLKGSFTSRQIPRKINPAYAEDAKALWGYETKSEKRLVNPAYAEEAHSLWGYNGNENQNDKRDSDNGHLHGSESPEAAKNEFADYLVPGSLAGRSISETDLPLLPNGWVDYGAIYEAPSAINPIYQNLSADHQLYKRAESGPLYGPSGRPAMEDVHQTTNPSCGFASVMAAVAYSNPEWIASKIKYSGDASDVASATVTMYDPKTGQQREITIAHEDTARNSDIDPATGIWWPGLYDHAAVQLGMTNQQGAIGPVGPWDSLRAITGFPASTSHSGISADDLFKMVQRASTDRTPMILQTKQAASTLVNGHAFAVLGGSDSGGERKIQLYNPWGSKLDVGLEVAMRDMYALWTLKDFNSFNGPSSNQQPAPAPSPDSRGQKTVTQNQSQPTTMVQQEQQQVSSTRYQRRPRPTPVDGSVNGGINVVNANAQPTPEVEESKAEDDAVVVVVEEVVTVTVVV